MAAKIPTMTDCRTGECGSDQCETCQRIDAYADAGYEPDADPTCSWCGGSDRVEPLVPMVLEPPTGFHQPSVTIVHPGCGSRAALAMVV